MTPGRCGSTVEVVDGGPFTTVQDLPGRIGYWHVGVPPNGPMDDLGHRLVNRVVGNAATAAALELTGAGPTLRFRSPAVVAVGGAPMAVTVDGAERCRRGSPIDVPAGAIVGIGATARPGAARHAGGPRRVRHRRVPRAAARRSPSAASAATRVGPCGPATCCAIGDGCRRRSRARCRRAWHRALAHRWRIGVLVGPHSTPEFLTAGRPRRPAADRVGGALQLGAHRRPADRATAGMGAARRRRRRPAPVEHPRHRLRDRRGRPHRRHAGDPRSGRTEPGRVRLPGRRGRVRAVEARPAAPGRHGAARRRGRPDRPPPRATVRRTDWLERATTPIEPLARPAWNAASHGLGRRRRRRPRGQRSDRRRAGGHLPAGRRPVPPRRVRRR